MKKYAAYKPSGVEWLGEVPDHWEVKRFKFALDHIEQGWSPQCDNNPADLGEWGVLKVGCVNGHEFEPLENKRLPTELEPRIEYAIQIGDVLMSRANTKELVGSVAVVHKLPTNLLLCDKLYRLRVKASMMDKSFLVYTLRSKVARAQYELGSSGASSSMQNIGQDTVNDLQIAFPPLVEQRAIAAFLDERTARLDGLIRRKEDLLKLLAEQRAALITRVVTRGLNTTAPLQESGVSWLGRVPAHWKVWPLKALVDFINGAPFKPEEWSDTGTPIIRIENLNGSEEFNSYEGEMPAKYLVNEGEILFGWSGNIGTSFGPFQWKRPGKHFLNQHIFRITGFSGNQEWLFWLLKAVTSYVESQAHGIIGMVHITKQKLGAVRVPLPPEDEQRQIAEYVKRFDTENQNLETSVKKTITKLREYRAALITAAVTGRIDVRATVAVPEMVEA